MLNTCISSGPPAGSSTSSHQTSTVNVSLPATSVPPLVQNTINISARPSEIRPSTPATPLSTLPRWIRPTYYTKPYEVPIEDEMDKSPPAEKNKGSHN